ncbi:MAG: type II toxin-antitoxin system prevent-host-death family antitoxin [Gemmatimonadales bacterium]|nr:type II toxin-antitoxin system prevent-host-death family antitoxin [Gemmatimonadales bacterium]
MAVAAMVFANMVESGQIVSMTDFINIYDAKTQLSQLVDKALAGEEVVIARHGRPLVKLVPYAPVPPPIRVGLCAGQFWIAPDFDAAEANDEIWGAWGMGADVDDPLDGTRP